MQVEGLRSPFLDDPTVLRALRMVPRELFVPEVQRPYAHLNEALAIGYEQTISQPVVVGIMVQAAGVAPGKKILEIGTGSGYQSAVLAECGARVFSVEVIPELAAQSRRALDSAGYQQVRTRVGDGYFGWPEEAPFDAIIISARTPVVPPKLLDQLSAHGGRMVLPLERPEKRQKRNDRDSAGEDLVVIERHGEKSTTHSLGGVRFVPMTGRVRE